MTDRLPPDQEKAGQRRRALYVLLGVFALLAVVLYLGRSSLALDQDEFHRWFEAFRGSPWSYVIVIATFTLGAFLALPQWALIAGVTATFGPFVGGALSWVSTIISASVDFWLGRWVGAERLEQLAGKRIRRIMDVLRRNGFLAGMTVRIVPTAPFVVVNMAAGVSGMRFLSFISGSAVGVVPKIVIVALFTSGVLSATDGKKALLYLIPAVIIFLVLTFIVKRRLSPVVSAGENDAEK